MKLKNYLLICIIFAILISSISTINAISNDNINNLSEWNSNNDHISIENNEQKCSINDNGNILDLKKNDINGEEDDNLDDNEYDELDDDVEEDWDENNESTDEDDDDDDELDTWNIADELDDEDINEYLECINSTTDTYLKFIKYLIKDKGFKFNNLFSEEDEGYHIFASQTYEGKLYDGNKFLISKGDSYYVSTNPRMAYVLDTYYPDVICSYDDKYSIDEMYLGWLKWEEKYQLSLNPSDKVDFINSTVFTSNSSILPPTFDLRNVNGNNYVTPIKDQGRAGNCWAFASIAALESYLLKSEGISYNFSNTIDLSENNLKNVMSSRGEMGMETPTNEGGNSNIGESELYTTEGWVDVSKLFKNANLCLNAYTEYDNRLPTKIEAFDLTMTYGENNILTATLTDLNNTRLKNMNLTFCIDNNTYVITTNEDGQATMQINNLPNTYKVVIHYFGNEKYSDTRKTITLTINPIIKDNVDIFFDIKDIKSQIKFSLKSEGKPLKYGIVNIKIGKKWYKGKKLDKNGNYILKKHLNDPTKFTVNFLGNNYFKPTSKSIYIYENLDITGLKSCEDTGKLHLILTKTINLKVCLKISSKKFKLKFKNGKVTFKPSKYKLKKGKKYKLVFSFKNNKYHLNKSYKLKIK